MKIRCPICTKYLLAECDAYYSCNKNGDHCTVLLENNKVLYYGINVNNHILRIYNGYNNIFESILEPNNFSQKDRLSVPFAFDLDLEGDLSSQSLNICIKIKKYVLFS